MNTENNKKIEEILNSLEGCQRVPAPDFFYTRLKAKMEKGLEPASPHPWILRPVFVIAALLVVLLINAVVVFNNDNSPTIENASIDTETIQSIAAEYRLNDNGILYDLNKDK